LLFERSAGGTIEFLLTAGAGRTNHDNPNKEEKRKRVPVTGAAHVTLCSGERLSGEHRDADVMGNPPKTKGTDDIQGRTNLSSSVAGVELSAEPG
jgi:hypothetical protein